MQHHLHPPDTCFGADALAAENRTVYVGRIHVSDDIEEIVARHFAEWGQVERIRVLNSRGVAFITYVVFPGTLSMDCKR